jgi:tRNA G18 (ribose-2'-O)-methylase SpoU
MTRSWRDDVQQWHDAAAQPGVVLLDGFHALKHVLRFDGRVLVVLASDKSAVLKLARELAGDVESRLAEIVVQVPQEALREVLPRAHPTGVAALAVRPSDASRAAALRMLPRRAPIVVLDNPRNLGNIGAVIRLAAGFGATGVVTTGDIDPWHPNVVRASAGLHFATAVDRLDLGQLPPGPLYALDPQGEDIRKTRIPDDALLAFGSERHGISAQLRAAATALVAIPMRPQVSSFNLATSAAMALFHWMSQQHPLAPGDVPRG